MSLVRPSDRLQLPETLQTQLYDFRKLVWTIKMIEAVCGAVAGVLLAFLILFVLDRLGETPTWARFSLFAATVAQLRVASRSPCIAGCGATDVWSNWLDCSPASIPMSATSCWESSSWCGTTSSRRARARCASPPFARSPKTPKAATFATRSPTPGIGCGRSWRSFLWWPASLCWRSIRPPASTLGRGCWLPGGDSSLHVRRRPAIAGSGCRRAWRADFARGASRAKDGHQTG